MFTLEPLVKGDITLKNHKLRQRRARKFWTQSKAAEELGVSLITYQRWELGIQHPSLVSLQRLCDVFQVQPEDLDYGYILPSEAVGEPSVSATTADPIPATLALPQTFKPLVSGRFTHPTQPTHEDLMEVAKNLFPKEYPPKLNKFQDTQFTCHVFYNVQIDKAMIASIKSDFRRLTMWTLGCQAKVF